MIARGQQRITFHAAVVLIVGLLCGFPFALALTGNWGEEPVRAWRFAHLGLTLTGIWLLATSAVMPSLVLGERAARLLVWSLVSSAYGFSVALVVAAIAGVRGLEPGGPTANWFAFLGNTVGAFAGLFGAVTTLVGARRALRSSRADGKTNRAG